MFYIYALIDPISKKIRYIGKSFDPIKRLSQHIKESIDTQQNKGRRKWNKRYAWIFSLLSKGLKPEMEILEVCNSKEQSNEREKYWISITPNLVNMTIGGDGGNTNVGKKFGPFSNEIKNKISINTKKAMISEEIRNKCSLGGKITSQKIKYDVEFRKNLFVKIRNGAKKRVCFFDNEGKVNLIYDSISVYEKLKGSINKNYETFRGIICKYETSSTVEVISTENIEIKSINKETVFLYTIIK